MNIDVDLPDDTVLALTRTAMGVRHYTLEGGSVEHIRGEIENKAKEHGFDLKRIVKATYLRRHEQCVSLFFSGEDQLTVTVDDPESLPLAQVDERGVAVGPVSIPLDGVQIRPRRERSDEGSLNWVAEWEVDGTTARQLSSAVVDALVSSGLRHGGVFEPQGASVGDTWTSEASSATRLVKVHATQRQGDVVLRIEVIDEKQCLA